MSSKPILAGVCGWPIHHSLSPILHSHWLERSRISGAYLPFAVNPKDAVKSFKDLHKVSIQGVNVTLPLKDAAFEAADVATEEAHRLGAANCLYKAQGKLVAHNTDLEGFLAPLFRRLGRDKLQSGSALVIGAGGAARAVLGGLLSIGVPEACLINRTDSRAEDVVSKINVPSLYALPWAQRADAVSRADLIVNASAAGMEGKPALDISLERAKDSALIYDLIYTPLMTPLMQSAKDRGLPYLGGLEMLVAQARPSFKHFYGELPYEDGSLMPVLIKALETGRR